jgi:hypothetical protein
MSRIILYGGQSTLVDEDTCNRYKHLHSYMNREGYVVVQFDNGTLHHLHRLVMAPIPPGIEVDHINGHRLDNRRANLRLVTRQQNLFNRCANLNTPTGYKGITFTKGRWKARIQKDGSAYSLGCYDEPEAAALAYNLAAKRLFGEYARLNDVDHPDREAIARQVEARLLPRNSRPFIPKARSHYRGVYWERGRWRAKIGVDCRLLHLGYFTDEIEAAKAYDRAALLWHGERAQLNFGEVAS